MVSRIFKFKWDRSSFEEYAKHSALNLGQALHELRFFYSHPDFDKKAPRGSLKHFQLSCEQRSKRALNDLFYATIPPHWHHSEDELASLHQVPIRNWFLAGYSAWRFNEDGTFKDGDMTGVDQRWDPRCLEHDAL